MASDAAEDIAACAALVQKADPDRFAATMAAKPAAREKLLPIYAFNVEVARAPWVTQESMIAEMRLQWWRDALEEIKAGGMVRRHEVVTPLALVLDGESAALLDQLIEDTGKQHVIGQRLILLGQGFACRDHVTDGDVDTVDGGNDGFQRDILGPGRGGHGERKAQSEPEFIAFRHLSIL